MAFADTTKAAAYRRAGGQCECTMSSCNNHRAGSRCQNRLGNNWHAHHRTAVAAGGSDDLGNLLAMCIPCHENTLTYGRRR